MEWPWKRKVPAEDDLRELRNDIADVRSEVKRLRVEWEDMYDKLVRRTERLRKQEDRAGTPDEQLPLLTPLDRKRQLRALARGLGGKS